MLKIDAAKAKLSRLPTMKHQKRWIPTYLLPNVFDIAVAADRNEAPAARTLEEHI